MAIFFFFMQYLLIDTCIYDYFLCFFQNRASFTNVARKAAQYTISTDSARQREMGGYSAHTAAKSRGKWRSP